MISSAFTKIFGTNNERVVKRMMPTVAAIGEWEPKIQALSDAELREKTIEFRARFAARLEGVPDTAENKEERKAAEDEALNELLPEAFAVVREAGKRAVGMRHFDVQLIGGMVLHSGKIAEMKTGEGKTLVATLPVYLNALAGKGVHVVTVNDYLAKRDAEWMGKIYEFLGLTVGVIVHDLDDAAAPRGLRGGHHLRNQQRVRLRLPARQHEVRAGGLRAARALLRHRGRGGLDPDRRSADAADHQRPTDQTTDKYARVNRIIPQLEQGEEIEQGETKTLTGDYVVDEKHKTISVTDEGWEKIEELLGIGNIADPENWDSQAPRRDGRSRRTRSIKRDVEYVVKDGEVIIVDDFTGRLMPGRRWSDGLHQAVEAKEGVNIRREDQTLATITFQNYFRMYKKLAGMTGTAETEAAEFDKIYKLDIVVIPTNRPMRRKENQDVVYRTAKEKYFAVADEIAAAERGEAAGAGGHHVD